MTVLERVLEWSPQLPRWQSDALRRLFARRELSADDYGDLVALALLESGIPDEKGRTPEILDKKHLPVTASNGALVTLRSMGPLRGVNALITEQILTVGETGVTVIYGDNGAGKSGYARVLKSACRARDEERVLPNAELPKAQQTRAQAHFCIAVDGQEQRPVWTNGSPSPDALSALSVFDSRCARVYLDDERDIAYKPYGLDLVEDLGKVCDEIKRQIRESADRIRADLSAFDDLKSATTIGRLLATVSVDTDTAEIEALAKLSEDDKLRIVELDSLLKEPNPLERARTLRDKAARISRLAGAIDRAFDGVSEECAGRLAAADVALLDAKQASKAVQDGLHADGVLPGTGGELWKRLLVAAQAYSREAYPHHSFPHVSPDARCVLCQQPLTEGRDRYQRFCEFLQSAAEAELNKAADRLSTIEAAVSATAIDLPLDPELQGEIESLDPALGRSCSALGAVLAERKCSLLDSVKSHSFLAVPSLPANPSNDLRSLATQIGKEAETFEKSAEVATRASLKQDRLEFTSREALADRKDSLIRAIEDYKLKRRLDACADGIDTAPISRKSRALAQEAISRSLAKALNDEFAALGVDHLKVSVTTRANYGQTLQKLRLDLPTSEELSSILSEGEQRALAIASFLAEISIGSTDSGIVFDDPVSSLDHLRRERLAERLVQEGKRRQVIIFTHDLYFLKQLTQEAIKQKVPMHYQTILRSGDRVGIVSSDLPFEGKTTADRVGELKQLAQNAIAAAKRGDTLQAEAMVQGGYSKLRQSWERAIEEVLFQSTIERFNKGVQTERLKGVTVEDQDYEEVYNGMTRCSEFTGHDRAASAGTTVLDPHAFEKDVLALDSFRTRVDKRAKVIEKVRKPRRITATAPSAITGAEVTDLQNSSAVPRG